MKKKIIMGLFVLAAVIGMGFAAGKSRAEVQRFVANFESAVNDLSRFTNQLKRGNDNSARQNLERAIGKVNQIQNTFSFYAEDLAAPENQDLYDRFVRAGEKCANVNAELQTYAQINSL